jgi:hypothetical protein
MPTLTCDHSISAVVRQKFYGRELCPACLIDQYIVDIRNLQAVFESRGGIFASNPKSTEDPESLRHEQYLKVWRLSKIGCHQDIQLLEQLRAEFPQMAEEWGVTSALSRWDNARDELSRIPGCNYIEDKGNNHDPAKEHVTDWTASSSTSMDLIVVAKPTPTPIKPHQRSALKGHRTSTLGSSHPTFSKTSTIITHRPFPSTLEPHNRHTDAELSRSRDKFNRTSNSYKPSLWASPDGYEKEDTSHCNTNWYKYQKMMKIGVWEEKKPVRKSRTWERFKGLNIGVGERESER